jgi:hypothetical protein
MSIPFICRTARTQEAAASPTVAVSAAADAAVLALVTAAERSLEELTSISNTWDGPATAGHMVPAPT